MAFDTFVPTVGSKFSQGTSESHEPRVLEAGFGDGYVQRTGDGLNADLGELNVMWNVMLWEEGQPMIDFFAAHKGYIPFKFTLPGESEPRKYICKKWNRTWSTEKTVDISATWREVADPE